MLKNTAQAALAWLALTLLAVLPAQAQDWQLLGQTKAGIGSDVDRVQVTGQKGRFTQIRLDVERNDILLNDLRVVFENGETVDLAVRRRIPKGGSTGPLDLPGRARAIKEIQMRYQANVLGFRSARVLVYGLEAPQRAPEPDRLADLGPAWDKIGTQRVNYNRESDIIDVSRSDGLFDALLLRVLDNGVRFYRVRVTYGNGDREDLEVRDLIRRNSDSKVFELPGRRGRYLDSIELQYETNRDRGQRATVEVWGRRQQEEPLLVNDINDEWEKIATQTVEPRRESDVVDLRGDPGPYRAIFFRVIGSNVDFDRALVVFGNGQREDVDVGEIVRAGGDTKIFDFAGREPNIRRIEFTYRALRGGSRRATVEVWAQKETPLTVQELDPDEWKRVGSQRVNLDRENDVIELSRRDGRFDALVLRVQDQPVRFYGAEVVFGNGERAELPIRERIRPGGDSAIFEFEGGDRFIDRIELAYETARRRGGRATVEVWGRTALPKVVHDFNDDWERVGVQLVNFDRETDSVRLSRRDGRFNAIAMRVKVSPVRFFSAKVTYGNGDTVDIPVDRRVASGSDTEIFEIDGQGRFIAEIAFDYQTLGRRGDRATVEVWGKKEPPLRTLDLGADWKRLAAQDADRGLDRDVIRVGRNAPVFNMMALRVKERAVRVQSIRAIFEDGGTQDFEINDTLRAGEDSGLMLLEGNSPVERIELRHELAERGRRAGVVEIWANELQNPGEDWVYLGSRIADTKRERDVFEVGRDAGRLTAVKIGVSGESSVYFYGVDVEFGNRERQELRFRSRIEPGSATRDIDLEGRGRFVRKIEFDHEATGNRGPALVHVWGSKREVAAVVVEPPATGGLVFSDASWTKLGSVPISRRAERLKVNLPKPMFVEGIVLRSIGGNLRLDEIMLVDTRGRRMPAGSIPLLRSGQASDPIVTESREPIAAIYMVSQLSRSRSATLEVFVQPAEREVRPKDLLRQFRRGIKDVLKDLR